MSVYSDSWKRFKELSPEEQKGLYKEFEAKVQNWLDANFYKDLGRIVSREGTIDYDLILNANGRNIKIEEKIRARVYEDFLIEIMQDVIPPFQTASLGWLYYCKADRMIYALCDSPLEEHPTKIFSVNLRELKRHLPAFIKERVYTIPSINYTGKGLSLNIAIPWDILKMNNIAKELYSKPIELKKSI